jgi:hypothetical protein
MGRRPKRPTKGCRATSFRRLLLVFFLFFIVLIDQIAVPTLFGNLVIVVIFVVIVIPVFGNDVQMDGMRLRDFELGFALGATENLAFFDFVLIDVDFCGTFGAANHGNILRKIVGPTRAGKHASMSSVLYTGCVKSTPMRGDSADR